MRNTSLMNVVNSFHQLFEQKETHILREGPAELNLVEKIAAVQEFHLEDGCFDFFSELCAQPGSF